MVLTVGQVVILMPTALWNDLYVVPVLMKEVVPVLFKVVPTLLDLVPTMREVEMMTRLTDAGAHLTRIASNWRQHCRTI